MLTFGEDKLIALTGIANVIQKRTNLVLFAGLWKQYLLRELHWHTSDPRTRPNVYRAPSWSWASIDGVVKTSYMQHVEQPYQSQPNARILHAEVTPADSSSGLNGQLSGRVLLISGRWRKALIQKLDPSEEDYKLVGENGEKYPVFLRDVPLDDVEMAICLLLVRWRAPLGSSGGSLEHCINSGLVLVPSGKANDEYLRVGYFEYHFCWKETPSIWRDEETSRIV